MSVESLNVAGRSLQEAEVGRVLEVQMDDRCGKLVSVESVNTAGRSLRETEVGRVVEVQLDDRCG